MNRGFLIIEVVVGVAILGLMGVALVGEIFYGQKNSFVAGNLNRAVAIAHEGMEIAKNIRDEDFQALDVTKRGLQLINNEWELVTSPQTVDNYFQREIDIVDVTSDKKMVTVTVYALNAPTTVRAQLVTHFTNWFANVEDWTQPRLCGSFDFTSANSGSNNHNAQTASAASNYLYVGNANSAGKEFVILDITNSPNLVMRGVLDLDGTPDKIAVKGDYAYVASGSQTQELQVLNVADKNNIIPGTHFDLTTANSGNENNDAVAVDVSGNLLVLVRINSAGQEFFTFDVSNPGVPALTGKTHLDGNPTDVKIFGNNAFITSDDNLREVQIVDISNPSTPAVVASYNLVSGDENSDAQAIDIFNNRLYIGRKGAQDAPEVYLFKIDNPLLPELLSTLNLSNLEGSGSVKHISFAHGDNHVFALTDSNDSDFKVIQVTNNVLSPLSYLDIGGNPNQADYSKLTQHVYVVGKADPEVQVICSTYVLTPPLPVFNGGRLIAQFSSP